MSYKLMKKGQEIGLEVIKTENREGSTVIRGIHEKINEVLYPCKYRYISPSMTQRILNKLIELGKQLNDAEINDKAKAKKEELLEATRERVKSLKEYAKTYPEMTDSDISQVQATLKFQLAQYLKAKGDGGLDVQKLLRENKQIWDEMYLPCPSHDRVQTTDFVKMQDELINMLTKTYRLK